MKMLTIFILSLGVLSGCSTIKETPKKQTQTSGEFLTASCIANDFEACTFLGVLAVSKGDYIKARSYLIKACDGKNAFACKELGLLKERLSNNSLSAKPDLTRACKMGSQDSCNYLRVINFTDKKTNELFSHFEDRCSKKDSIACLSIGYGMADARNFREAKNYFEKACLLKAKEGCFSQAQYEFFTYQFDKAIALYKDLCKEKFMDSCHYLKLSQMPEEP